MEQRTVDAPVEIVRLERAIGRAIARLDKLLSASHGPVTAILGAQQEMLDDPELKQGADALIVSGFSGEAAITRVADEPNNLRACPMCTWRPARKMCVRLVVVSWRNYLASRERYTLTDQRCLLRANSLPPT